MIKKQKNKNRNKTNVWQQEKKRTCLGFRVGKTNGEASDTSNGGMAMSESVAVSNTSNMWGKRRWRETTSNTQA
jgi:hypothetical protein